MYLGAGDDRVLLPNKYVPERLSIGDLLDVFVYTDSEDRLVATTLKPAGVVGDFVFLIAKDVTSFGMMYANETYQKLFIGDTCKGYIMRIREDGKIDLSIF